MAKTMQRGICRICGDEADLEFEHSPPRSAGNNQKVIEASHESYWNQGPGQGKPPKGKQFQRGFGGNVLCGDCNRKTGKWYVGFFAGWTRQGTELYSRANPESDVLWTPFIFPLPVLKQIVTIFLARTGDTLGAQLKAPLCRFVLDRNARNLDQRYRFWTYFVAPGPLRNTPFLTIMNIENMTQVSGVEVSFPPFGYMMTVDSKPEDDRLCEITHFSRYAPLEADRATLGLVSLPTHSPVLGDYRSFREMGIDSPGVVMERWPNVSMNME
jgi:hypothetical protein